VTAVHDYHRVCVDPNIMYGEIEGTNLFISSIARFRLPIIAWSVQDTRCREDIASHPRSLLPTRETGAATAYAELRRTRVGATEALASLFALMTDGEPNGSPPSTARGALALQGRASFFVR
jgi:hypothetical protein